MRFLLVELVDEGDATGVPVARARGPGDRKLVIREALDRKSIYGLRHWRPEGQGRNSLTWRKNEVHRSWEEGRVRRALRRVSPFPGWQLLWLRRDATIR
jgi:hypothetical protein